MTIETLLVIIVFALFYCYLVYRWQDSAAPPPYQDYPAEETEPSQAAWPFPHSKP